MRIRSHARLASFGLAACLLSAVTLASAVAARAAEAVVLHVGDQKGGNRSLLDIAGLAQDLPYLVEGSEFPASAPILGRRAGSAEPPEQGAALVAGPPR